MSFFKKLLLARLKRTPTRAQWFGNLQNLEHLRHIVTDPVFIAACNHIIDERRINEHEVFTYPDLLPLRAAYSAGHTAFLRDLESLTLTPNPNGAIQLEEWGHITPED